MTGAPRKTRQRAAVLSALKDGNSFMSAQEWHDRLRHEGSEIGLATVYRTLQSLAESGEVDTVMSDDGEALYRRCEDSGHHHHLRCRDCGTAVDIEGPSVEDWAHAIGATHGFTEIEHIVELNGICSTCSTKER